MKSTPTRGVKQFLKPNAYNQSELDWTLMTISAMSALYRKRLLSGNRRQVADKIG